MPKCWQDVEKPDDSYVADEGMKLFSHSGKQFSGFFKKKSNYHTTLPLSTWAFIQRNEDLCSHINMYKSI